ncbi:GGDEF domain-containing protein [Bacillus marinisedimentorum]|uniref:GGDEF domain-containing protein n=1 Tax=Bacillus marinisedimentorum TaxID=1821260 RepID=UPI000871F03F|nr:GGDEF domain-containing protein [Bacillus marinisedimentorum]
MADSSTSYENNHFHFIIDKCMQLGFVIHFAWAFLFFWLNAGMMGYLNLASSLAYLVGYHLNKKSHTSTALLIGHLEIVIYASLAVYTLGSNSGFQYFILDAIIVTFIAPQPRLILKSFILIIDTAVFAALSLLFRTPFIQLESTVLNGLHLMNIVTLFLTLAIATHFFRTVTVSAEDNLVELNKELEVLANTDMLTNLLNRRSMFAIINEEAEHLKKFQKPHTLILADIDDFKSINDSFGHDCGDFVLKECSSFLKSSLRKNDYIARWGGEEFLIVLHETDQNEAYRMIERIRANLDKETFHYQGIDLSISLTFGMTEYNDPALDASEYIKKADKALIIGKNQGKDCVVVL